MRLLIGPPPMLELPMLSKVVAAKPGSQSTPVVVESPSESWPNTVEIMTRPAHIDLIEEPFNDLK
jgi:hypothetical protein